MVGVTDIVLAVLVLAAFLSVVIASYVYRYRNDTIGARYLMGIFVGQALWSLAYALQLTSSAAEMWLFLDRFVATGATFIIAGWGLFVLSYTGYERRLSTLQVALLLGPFVIGVVAAWTNHYHGLFWQLQPRPEVLLGSGGRYLVFEPGILYTPWLVYLFGIVIASLVLLGAKYVRSRSLHRAQVGLVFVAILLPLVGNIVFTAVTAGTLSVDITPLLFTATGILVVIALKRYRMLDSVPVSQHVLLEQLSEGVVVTDTSDDILHCNAAAMEMFGADIIGDDLQRHLPTDTTREDLTQESGAEVTIPGTDRQRHFDVNRMPYTDHRGDDRGAIYVFQDITDRHQHAESLARQNERLNQFASLVSHDLRNPLNVVQMRLALVEDGIPNDHFTVIDRNLTRMETMIDELLTMAQAGQTVEETDPVVLPAVARDAWEHAETGECELEVALPDDMTIQADRDRLLHVFENLFRNAADHNDPPLTVRVGTVSDGTLDGTSETSQGFFVADTGDGIAQDKRDAVFDHGYTTSDDGTGFGLSIVQDIVDAHGWTIHVTDSASGGTRFEITGLDTG